MVKNMNEIKLCVTCDNQKGVGEFHKNSSSIDGRVSKCKACQKVYDAKRDKDPARIAIRKAQRDSPERRLAQTARNIKYNLKHPKKARAHWNVRQAVARGQLEKGACEKCGTSDDVHGHHDDYSKVLDVRWLCRSHHQEWHTEHGEAANAT